MERLPISVCVIANSDPRLALALDSVKDWVAELIVVLNDDTDAATEQAARDRGARVFREKWKGHVAQKNSAADKAGQPWILGLDADEAVSELLRADIQRLFADPVRAASRAAWRFPRCAEYYGRWIRHGDWYPDWQTRLWQRGRARWGGIDPHDKLMVDGAVGRLRGDLLHYSQESFDQVWMKAHRYAGDFVRTRRQAGKTVSRLDLFFRPPWRFFRCYVLLGGFLDGWQGYSIACMTAAYTYLRYAKAYESQLTKAAPRGD